MHGRSQEQLVTEQALQQNVTQLLKKHKYVFALCSSTDMERLASFNAACKNAGRVFLVDKYQSSVLDIFSKYAGTHSPLFKFDTFRLINFTNEQTKRKLATEGFLLPIRANSFHLVKKMLDIYNDETPWLIYSMWGGYAEKDKEYTIDSIIKIRKLFKGHMSDGTKDGVHTSGHADMQTLADVCRTVNPRIGVIPIHKDKNTRYESLSGISAYKIFHEGNTTIENISISIK